MNFLDAEVPIDSVNFIPEVIRESLKKIGITAFRRFQIQGIVEGLKGKNLLITAPTGSGKTLIGEILGVIKALNNKKVLYLVPYKALAEEFKNTFSKRYPFIRVGIGTGDYREVSNEKLGRLYDFLIVTYEKADSILRDSPSWLDRLELVIVDEIHLLGDYDRGPILDIVLTRLKQVNCQIIGLSATIPNPEDIAEWLKATMIISKKRPVKLIEGVFLPKRKRYYFYDPNPDIREVYLIKGEDTEKIFEEKPLKPTLEDFFSEVSKVLGSEVKILKIEEKKGKKIERIFSKDDLCFELEKEFRYNIGDGGFFYDEIERIGERESFFMKAVLDLTYDLFQKMIRYQTLWQILIFRRSRKLAQLTAKKIANMMKKTKLFSLFPESAKVSKKLLETIQEKTPLTEELAECLRYGVAFHHAGLSKEERLAVEWAFRERKIGVIVATPTLAAGINLPARRVVIEYTMYDRRYLEDSRYISVSHYKQRCGRAGRPGLDFVGESVLIAKTQDELVELFRRYIFGDLESVVSYLGINLPVLREQLLALIVSNGELYLSDLNSFFSNTYFFHHLSESDNYQLKVFKDNIMSALRDLISWNFIEKREEFDDILLRGTKLGFSVTKLYLDPLTAIVLVNMIRDILKENIFDEITIFKYITKTNDTLYYRHKILISLNKINKVLRKVPQKIRKEILNCYGENISEILKLFDEGFYINLSPDEEDEVGSLGLVAILILWINEYPIKEILEDLSPTFGAGDFVEFIRTCERLIYSSRELSKVLGASKRLIKNLDILRRRVAHGVREELLQLTEIPLIGRVRAKVLYEHGYRSLNDLAKARVDQLAKLPTIGETIAKRIKEYVLEKFKKI